VRRGSNFRERATFLVLLKKERVLDDLFFYAYLFPVKRGHSQVIPK
jgi:hypothetical protein